MRGCIETIPGREQDALLNSGLAESAAVLSAYKPGESSHSATRPNPSKLISMLGHEAVKEPKILSCSLLRFPEYGIPVAHGDLRQHFSGSVVRNGEISSRIPVLLTSLGVVLDYPSGSDSG